MRDISAQESRGHERLRKQTQRHTLYAECTRTSEHPIDQKHSEAWNEGMVLRRYVR